MSAIQDIPLKTIDGGQASLRDYAGQVLLLVNVASKCGLTPQYEALERVYSAHRGQGLTVLGFPCNQFLGQEPAAEPEIAAFCQGTYGVDFPLFSKVEVKGPGQHPLYAALTEAVPQAQAKPDSTLRERLSKHGVDPRPGEILWNFEKFLVSRDGAVVARFAPDIVPDDPIVTEAIAAQLAG